MAGGCCGLFGGRKKQKDQTPVPKQQIKSNAATRRTDGSAPRTGSKNDSKSNIVDDNTIAANALYASALDPGPSQEPAPDDGGHHGHHHHHGQDDHGHHDHGHDIGHHHDGGYGGGHHDHNAGDGSIAVGYGDGDGGDGGVGDGGAGDGGDGGGDSGF
ncbi:hypothetical protein Dda_4072 [Drechslerella dactyloides]|uniref:Uncharacterized protein n=1 Tax=Drechslerella dactyloides TaxID=74499 RepID=A0AAD6J3I7_DREDA|nr:hypothetical protein Dda_4072 [Drechslerella dactyloides]